jgi:hypothetical protein
MSDNLGFCYLPCSTKIEMSGFSKVEMSAFSIYPRYPAGMETVTMSYEELDRVSVIERVIEKRRTATRASPETQP